MAGRGDLYVMSFGGEVGSDGRRSSMLLDEFERLTFEIQLNQAILRRSFSSPVVLRGWCQEERPPDQKPPSRLMRALRMLLKPFYGVSILRRRKAAVAAPAAACSPRGPQLLKAFSKSCRVREYS